MLSGTPSADFLFVSAGKSAARRMLSGTSSAGCFPAPQVESNPGDGTMRYETGTFELRDNDMMMRELSSAETDEVAGGVGIAAISAQAQSGAGSTLPTRNGAFALATTNSSATAALATNVAATVDNNLPTPGTFALRGLVPRTRSGVRSRNLKLNANSGDGTMRYETGTFELRDNDMMIRELSSAETDEVAGGVGTAAVTAITASGAGTSLTSHGGKLFLVPYHINALAAH